ncbi:hypothetical protein [Deinococcus betulae]|uniref:hypothetical protein n=1 Tax=Deinococcus betulae TaxID=2873312 RepID=UPI0027154811|nr:hypothetical protein [Deinococcus betulae]
MGQPELKVQKVLLARRALKDRKVLLELTVLKVPLGPTVPRVLLGPTVPRVLLVLTVLKAPLELMVLKVRRVIPARLGLTVHRA